MYPFFMGMPSHYGFEQRTSKLIVSVKVEGGSRWSLYPFGGSLSSKGLMTSTLWPASANPRMIGWKNLKWLMAGCGNRPRIRRESLEATRESSASRQKTFQQPHIALENRGKGSSSCRVSGANRFSWWYEFYMLWNALLNLTNAIIFFILQLANKNNILRRFTHTGR